MNRESGNNPVEWVRDLLIATFLAAVSWQHDGAQDIADAARRAHRTSPSLHRMAAND